MKVQAAVKVMGQLRRYLSHQLLSTVQAVRDHEYMGRFSGQRHDPFRVSGERFQERWLLKKLMRHKTPMLHFNWFKDAAIPTGPWEDGEDLMRPIGGTRGEAFRHALWSRASGALVAAAFLVGPMWALALEQNIYLQLGVTTGCIFAFGLVMVVAVGTLEAVLFAATLAYAAVLMVFVGVVMQSLSVSA